MPEGIKVDDLVGNIAESIAESFTKKKVSSFFDGEDTSSKLNRLFGREKPIHNVLGGGKSADLLLWRNKKISAGFLGAATVTWVLFEWLNYHLLSLLFVVVVLCMLAQFLWTNASGLLNRSGASAPRIELSEDMFANVGRAIGYEVNRALQFLQDVACGGNIKQFLMVVAIMWVAAIIGSWCNFLTVIYIGFVAAHTLPVFYEKYEDQVDDFAYKVLGQVKGQYSKLDSGFLSKIPRGVRKEKKVE